MKFLKESNVEIKLSSVATQRQSLSILSPVQFGYMVSSGEITVNTAREKYGRQTPWLKFSLHPRTFLEG